MRVGKWENIYNSIESAVYPYSYEVIFVGPYVNEIPKMSNVKAIVDYGCPSRCVQIAALIAKGRYLTWGSDDGTYEPLTLGECIKLLDDNPDGGDWEYNYQDEVVVRYIEGLNNNPSLFEDGENNPHYRGPNPELKLGYWHAHYHEPLRLVGIAQTTRIAPLGMLATKRFIDLGGFDCRMQHINMSCIDLSLRLQNTGLFNESGKLLVSPNFVLKCDFEPNNVVHQVFPEVDHPIFCSLYESQESAISRKKIDYSNWMQAEPVWSRRWELVKNSV